MIMSVRKRYMLDDTYVLDESLHEWAVAYATRTEEDPRKYNSSPDWMTQIEKSFRVN